MKQPEAYILRSLKNNCYYTGSTNDLPRRLHQHSAGQVKATKYLLPLKLELSQTFTTLKEARQIELKL